MKKILTAVFIVCVAGSTAFASFIGTDDAANYSGTWIDGSTGGTGFSAWSIAGSGTGNYGTFIGDSAAQGFGDINTSGEAMGMYANPDGNSVNADRTFDGGALTVGQMFSIDLAVAFRNGNKGIDLDIGGTSVWNFNVGSDLYTVDSVDLGWDYAQDSIVQLDVTQLNATEIGIALTRGTDSYTDTVDVGGALDGFGLYVSGTLEGNDLNNLYMNNMEIAAVPEPVSAGLLGLGLGIIVLLRKKLSK